MPRYVQSVDVVSNTVVVAPGELLGVDVIEGDHLRWCGRPPTGATRLVAQVRAHGEGLPGQVWVDGPTVQVQLDTRCGVSLPVSPWCCMTEPGSWARRRSRRPDGVRGGSAGTSSARVTISGGSRLGVVTSASGIGSWPGTDVAEALRIQRELLGDHDEQTDGVRGIPSLPELPGRGPGGDIIGRTAGLLVDLAVDLQPAGWRFVDRPGRQGRGAYGRLLGRGCRRARRRLRWVCRSAQGRGRRTVHPGCRYLVASR